MLVRRSQAPNRVTQSPRSSLYIPFPFIDAADVATDWM